MASRRRQCPNCSSHETFRLGSTRVQRCASCSYRWRPCSDPTCEGFRILPAADNPAGATIRGCRYCDLERGGVRDEVVRRWPAAWHAIAHRDDRPKPTTPARGGRHGLANDEG